MLQAAVAHKRCVVDDDEAVNDFRRSAADAATAALRVQDLLPGHARVFYMEQVAVADPGYRQTLAEAYETGAHESVFVDAGRAAFWRAHAPTVA